MLVINSGKLPRFAGTCWGAAGVGATFEARLDGFSEGAFFADRRLALAMPYDSSGKVISYCRWNASSKS
jgi:hypothetical protein